MLLFWVCWASLYTPTPSRGHAESKSGYFSTRCYRNPPSPLPQFSQPPQLGRTPYWDRYVTVMPALFKCKQSKAPAHTILHTTTLLAREAFGTSSTPPLSCFPLQELMSLSPCSILYRLTGRISVCMIFIFQLSAFCGFGSPAVVFIEAPPPPALCHRPTIISSKSAVKAHKNRVSNAR